MPRLNETIRRQAREEAALLGHDIGNFRRRRGPKSQPSAQCRNCGWWCGQQHDFIYSNGWHMKPCEGAT